MNHLILQRAALAVALAFLAASPALAQFSGGINTSGDSDPRVLARALVVLVLGIGAIVCVGAWAKVAMALMGRGHVTDMYIWGCGAGTVILGACGFIAGAILGGGGGAGGLGGIIPA